ncbi:AAA family ATPase [Rhodobacterales bacterium LSUCC0031]|nr:AAA family ATPase [Rhodobacterales bacterium LSUCC0031]
MSFLTRHSPQRIADLVFRDATVANIIDDYAQGLRDNHLLLYGPAGSGKSIAAQIILKTQTGDLFGSAVAQPINPRDYSFDDFNPLLNDWGFQRTHGVPRGYTVIDEVDFFSDRMREKLRALIDSTKLGTIIATTNNLHKLDEPLKDRFRKLLIERPIAADWTARAQAIFAAEGVSLSTQQVSILLNGFDGSARELIEWLEDYTLGFQKQPLSVKGPNVVASTPCGIAVSPGKTLINGRALINTQGSRR